jgi:undecaprenyl-phosphate 4-deoxy-4-formamido-L-arabinose transferase
MVHRISIVIPVFRGESTIGPLVDRLFDELGELLLQVILVNDGSPDQSDRVCRELFLKYGHRVCYLKLSRNFGEHNAVMAGLSKSTGDFTVIMDDDFQNPPEEVLKLVEYASSHNYDVVYSHYSKKKHSLWRNLGSRLNDRMATILLKKPQDLYLSSFKCLNHWLVKEIGRYEGPYPYIDGLILQRTSRIGSVEVRHDQRLNGRSNYTLKKLISLWLRMFVNFSVVPLRISTVVGFLMSGIGALLGIAVVVERLVSPETAVGWASMVVIILLFSGVQLVMLGLIGEYLGRLFLTINGTPQYTVREELS